MAHAKHGVGAWVVMVWVLGMAIVTTAMPYKGKTCEEYVGTAPASRTCIGTYGSWMCWIRGSWVSWGSKNGMEDINDSQFPLPHKDVGNVACGTLRCFTVWMVEMVFDGFDMLFNDPLSLWYKLLDLSSYLLRSKLSFSMHLPGGFLFFLLLNAALFVFGRVADVLSTVSQGAVMCMHLPVVALTLRIVLSIWSFFVNIAKYEKEREAKAKQENKSVETVYVDLAKDMEEILRLLGFVDVETELEGLRTVLADIKKMLKEEAESGNQAEQQMGDVRFRCRYCKKPNHTEEEYWSKMSAHGIDPPSWRDRTPLRKEERSDGAGSSTPPARKVSVPGVQDLEARALLYTPADIAGVRFPRCLVSTGAEANLLSMQDARKHGFEVQLGGIQKICGFNRAESLVCGALTCDLRIGPSQESRVVKFLVTTAVIEPIIGFPTLKEFNISVDCVSHELVNTNTGGVVCCSLASKPKS